MTGLGQALALKSDKTASGIKDEKGNIYTSKYGQRWYSYHGVTGRGGGGGNPVMILTVVGLHVYIPILVSPAAAFNMLAVHYPLPDASAVSA